MRGVIVLEGTPLPEGSAVSVVAPEGDAPVRLGSAEEDELRTAIADADRGELIDATSFLRELDESD